MLKKTFLFVGIFTVALFSFGATAHAGNTITVNSSADDTNVDGLCNLREALVNTNNSGEFSSGDCVAGTGTGDTIVFSGSMTIASNNAFTITEAVTIDATSTGTCAAPGVTINAIAAGSQAFILTGNADGSRISGLRIRSYVVTGIELNGLSGSQTIISCNQIGLDDTGSVAAGGNQGIYIVDSSNILIGGPTAGDRNTIAGNQSSIYNQAIFLANGTGQTHDVTIEGNWLGVDATGLIPIQNGTGGEGQGIDIYNTSVSNITIQNNLFAGGGLWTDLTSTTTNLTVTNNTFDIGSDGTTILPVTGTKKEVPINVQYATNVTIQGNVFGSVNGNKVIALRGCATCTIAGNNIGYYADGITPAVLSTGYRSALINIQSSQDVVIGGTGVNDGNILNSTYVTGVSVLLNQSKRVTFFGNKFGLNKNNVPSSTTQSFGILVLRPTGAITIGGTNAGEGNYISKSTYGLFNILSASGYVHAIGNTLTNVSYGVGVETSSFAPGMGSYAAATRNSIVATVLPIALMHDSNSDQLPDTGLTPLENDHLDADTGANDKLNRPVLVSATQVGPDTQVTYMLDVPTSANPYRIDFFTNPSGILASGLGNGEVYAGYDTQTISSAGPQVFTATLSGVTAADTLAATVTSCSDVGCTAFIATSEFSNSTAGGIDLGTASGSQTALTDNGPYHLISSTDFLGVQVTADSISSVDSDDKDGVVFDATTYLPTTSATITVTAGSNGYLNAWFDANGDGDFDDTDEHFVDNESVTTGSHQYTINAPATDGNYNLRFRFTTYSASGLTPTGEALDGEVEDYVLTIFTPVVSGGGMVAVFGCSDPKATNYNPNVTLSSGCIYSGVKPNSSIQPTATTPVVKFTKTLKLGMNDIEVIALQKYLNAAGFKIAASGPGSPGSETVHFGKLTQKALIAYQEAHAGTILKPYKLTRGTGIFGPATRAEFAK